ncbi:RNA polymerase sigma factor [Actinomadura luteofluorescens]|uniref:RNA polymerase sigma factor n=1 Tax=Actinomadura luteofluorescens TaxID=46163 RepID=UPI00363F1BB9
MALRHRDQRHRQAPARRGARAAGPRAARPRPHEGGHADRVDARVSAQGLRGPLAGALAALPAGERDVLLLVALADLTHEEIAAALGIPYGTVGSRLSRARKKVRAALGGTDPAQVQEDDHG